MPISFGNKATYIMKNPLVFFAGTSRFGASISAMLDRLFLLLLSRIFSFLRNHSSGPPFGLPVHFLTMDAETELSSQGLLPPFLIQADWIELSSLDVSADISTCRWFAQEGSAVQDSDRTGVPASTNN